MFLNRNTALLLLNSSVFLIVSYFVFFRPDEKHSSLVNAYSEYLDSLDIKKSDSIHVQNVINYLSQQTSFNYCGSAGYTGQRIPIINPTPLLQHNLSELQLEKLCIQSGTVTKHFAFKALCELNPQAAKRIFKTAISDLSSLTYQCGCEGVPISINLDFFNTLKSKLSIWEYRMYAQKLKVISTPFAYQSAMELFNL